MPTNKTEKLFTKALAAARTPRGRAVVFGHSPRKGMSCPSAARLVGSIDRLSLKDANAIRKLCKTVDDPEALQSLIENHHPKTESYVQRLHSSPYGSDMWRRTVVLHAVNELVQGYGVESLGGKYEYINTGEMYADTLVFKPASNRLFVGSPGDIVERDSSL